MLRTTLIAKNCFRKGCGNENWLDILSGELKQRMQLNIARTSCFRRHVLRSWSSKNNLTVKRNATERSFNQYSSAQATELRNENFVPAKSHFQEMLSTRRIEAHRSVLIEVDSKEDVPFAIAYCEKYGATANIYSYPSENTNYFLLVEFSSEDSTRELFQNCGYQNIDDVFPVSSRIIKYVKKPNARLPKEGINKKEKVDSMSSFGKGASLSEVIQDIYETERLTETDIRLRFLLCALIKDSISGLFPRCDVLPFGSSVNGIGRRGCDLDIVIRLHPETVNEDGEMFFLNKSVGKNKYLQQMSIDYLKEYFLLSPGMSISKIIKFARVPIMKMEHKILNLNFDVSFNNTSAVLMSDILHFCGEVDPRVRPLMHVVKKWAKDANITLEYPGFQISNFGLANLVLFFLQTRKHPILPPLSNAVVITGSDNSYDLRLQYLEPIEKWKTSASLNKESLAALLKEFLLFVSTFNFHGSIISLMDGECVSRDENSIPLWIQYVMDEALNVTKNVSKAEYDRLAEKAKISARYLEKSLQRVQKVSSWNDFSAMLGIPSVIRNQSTQNRIKPDKFDVRSILSNESYARRRNKK